MASSLLTQLRRKRRAIAAVALGLFVANWLTLALAPCAMAYGVPGLGTAAVAAHGSDACPHCPPADPPCHAHDGGAAAQNPSTCEAVPKPAIDVRDSNPGAGALLLALAAPVLAWLPAGAGSVPSPAADPAQPPESPVLDRLGRRLE